MTVTSAVLYSYQKKNYPKKCKGKLTCNYYGSASKYGVISLPKKNTERFTHHLHLVESRSTFISYQLTFWKYEHFHEFKSLRQNGFTNDLHKNSFCWCFMNEAQ